MHLSAYRKVNGVALVPHVYAYELIAMLNRKGSKPSTFSHCFAAWAGSIPMAMMCILAPMASWVLNQYSLRLCTALLAIPIGLSFLVTSYATNMDEVIAAFSIPFGLTSCMLLMIGNKSLQVYFDKRMLTANGESVNGFFRILVDLFSRAILS